MLLTVIESLNFPGADGHDDATLPAIAKCAFGDCFMFD